MRRSRYELHLPYTIVLRIGWGGEEGMVYFFASQPAGPERARLPRDRPQLRPRPAGRGARSDFEESIFSQDQTVVESQRPEQVPFDLADELHLRFDAVAVAYRRAMRARATPVADSAEARAAALGLETRTSYATATTAPATAR